MSLAVHEYLEQVDSPPNSPARQLSDLRLFLGHLLRYKFSMPLSDWLSALGLAINFAGAYFLLAATRISEEAHTWPPSLQWLGKVFEVNAPRPSLWGLACLLIGFFLQFLGVLMR
ncbi:MAG TPA: hypothetical protein VL754_22485 [Verrucomicrobiae bacterium]|nr:hypothetical protein [Verrucomicrobiae bacterium]